MICQACGVEQVTEARFCEDCGSPLQAGAVVSANSQPWASQTTSLTASDASTCTLCGYGPGAFGPDGYCQRCGLERVDHSRDHVEVVVSPQLAGVSDVGMKHFRNEDVLALASEPEGEILVVCDGVSNSLNPDLASTAAASAALEAIRNLTACRSAIRHARSGHRRVTGGTRCGASGSCRRFVGRGPARDDNRCRRAPRPARQSGVGRR